MLSLIHYQGVLSTYIFADDDAAVTYLGESIDFDFALRVGKNRRRSFNHRVRAVHEFYKYLQAKERIGAIMDKVKAQWNNKPPRELQPREWAPKQQEILDWIAEQTRRSDANDVHDEALYVDGEPGRKPDI